MQYAKNDLGYLVRQHNELVNKIQKIHPEIEQLSKRIGLKPDDDFWKMYLNQQWLPTSTAIQSRLFRLQKEFFDLGERAGLIEIKINQLKMNAALLALNIVKNKMTVTGEHFVFTGHRYFNYKERLTRSPWLTFFITEVSR